VAFGIGVPAHLSERGAAEAIRRIQDHSQASEKLPEIFINALGYQMINAKKLEDAIALFIFTPNSILIVECIRQPWRGIRR